MTGKQLEDILNANCLHWLEYYKSSLKFQYSSSNLGFAVIQLKPHDGLALSFHKIYKLYYDSFENVYPNIDQTFIANVADANPDYPKIINYIENLLKLEKL